MKPIRQTTEQNDIPNWMTWAAVVAILIVTPMVLAMLILIAIAEF